MPLNALKRCEPLLDHLFKVIKPPMFIQQVAKGDRAGFFRNFKGFKMDRFGRPQLAKIAAKELYQKSNEFWAQLLIVLWNNEHRDLYNALKEKVETINPDVEKVTLIEDAIAETWMAELLEKNALEDILICVYLNEVRFSEDFVKSRMEAPLEIERTVPLFSPLPEEAAAAEPASA